MSRTGKSGWRVTVTAPAPRADADFDVIVGRFQQRAPTPDEAIAIVKTREYRDADLTGLHFYAD